MTTSRLAVHTTDDAMQAELLAEVLEAEGIEVELVGPRNAALLGVASHIVPLILRVPAEHAEQARELIEGLLAEQAVVDEAAPSSEPSAEAIEEQARPSAPGGGERSKRRVVAVGAALVVPGGAHYYGGRPWSGLVLSASFIALLVYAVAGPGAHAHISTTAVALGALVLLDVLGGLRALRRSASATTAAPAPRLRQLASGVGLAALAVAAGAVIGPRLPPPERRPSAADLDLLRMWKKEQHERRGIGGSADGGGSPIRRLAPSPLPWQPAAQPSAAPTF